MYQSALPKLAILITSYNRKDTTLEFLKSVVKQSLFDELQPDIYLLDDLSTDGTSEAVTAAYPFIKQVKGTGSLFWAGGMRTVWIHALYQQHYDLFLLCNDDVLLYDKAIENLLTQYRIHQNARGCILIGSTVDPITGALTYGGHLLHQRNHNSYSSLIPDASNALPCHLGNANILMADSMTVEHIGIFSPKYTHYLADFDYTLTADLAGINVLLAPGYYGTCADDHGTNWLSGSFRLRERVRYLYDVKGLAYKEYLYYIKKHFPSDYWSAFSKLWLKTLFPIIWDNFKKHKKEIPAD